MDWGIFLLEYRESVVLLQRVSQHAVVERILKKKLWNNLELTKNPSIFVKKNKNQ